ncbi:MAG: hypothetical protein IPK79_05060 [Vampirovibrionales bacterium]|nr:hypothetical protein [Vampirovibrionales bacterium]
MTEGRCAASDSSAVQAFHLSLTIASWMDDNGVARAATPNARDLEAAIIAQLPHAQARLLRWAVVAIERQAPSDEASGARVTLKVEGAYRLPLSAAAP